MQHLLNNFSQKVRVRVCGILRNEDGKVLFAKHKGFGEDYLWAPPGGAVHFGETLQQALIREFYEETGLSIQPLHFLFYHEHIATPLHAIEFFFAVKYINGQIKLGYDPELSPHQQILEDLQFLSLSYISQEKPTNRHARSLDFFTLEL